MKSSGAQRGEHAVGAGQASYTVDTNGSSGKPVSGGTIFGGAVLSGWVVFEIETPLRRTERGTE